MSKRLDELKGTIETQYGKLRKDDDMQATGAANAEEARIERKVEGALEAAAGSAEEYLGAQAGNPQVVADGEARRMAGKVKQAG